MTSTANGSIATASAPSDTANVDRAEIAKFEALASHWWDMEGDFKPLHDINPLRTNFSIGRWLWWRHPQ